tara:strand:- start:5367 stop:6434 length:1068 start_codon:yes stop_codon:yes gene_type:complete
MTYSMFNKNPLDPFGTNTLMGDIANTNQQVGLMNIPEQPSQQEQDFKRKQFGNMMLSFADVLKGRDPSAGVMQRTALLDAQKKEAERKAKLQQYKKNNPGMVDMLNALEAGVPASVFKGTNPTASIQEFQYAQQNGYKGSFQEFLNSKKATTNINTGLSGFQKSAVDNYNDSQDAAKDAMVINTSLDVIDNLLDKGIQTGFASGFDLGVQRIGQAIIGDNYKLPEVAGKEVFVAETTKLILPLVKQLGVNPTDKDLDFVRKGALELSKSAEGNKLMLSSLRLSQNRKIDENNFNNQYYKKKPQATIFERNIAFDEYKKSKPELYTSVSLIQAYDNLLLQQNSNNEIISSTEEAPF